MNSRRTLLCGLGLVAGLGFSTPSLVSQDGPEQDAEPARVAWFGTWEGGQAEAARTGRPILLMAATPQCHGVPGMW